MYRSWLFLPLVVLIGGACTDHTENHPELGAPDPTHSEMKVDRSEDVPADGSSRVTVTVVVHDVNDHPLPGLKVLLSVTGTGNVLSEPPLTDSTGSTSATLGSTVAEVKTLKATVEDTALDQSPQVTFVAGPAATLAFRVQPTDAEVGHAISPAIEVEALDAQGNSAQTFSGNVQLSIGTNPGSAVLTGTTTAGAQNGVASFPDLSLDKPGVGYTLLAHAEGLTNGNSATFDVARPVVGTRVGHFIGRDGGLTDVADDLSSAIFKVHVLLADGGFQSYPGSGAADGSFGVQGVPAQPFYLQYDNHYFGPSTTTSWDLGYANAGRPDATDAGPGTKLAYDVSGLSPYDPQTDDLQLFSPDLAMYGFGLEDFAESGSIAAGATSWQGVTPFSMPPYFGSALLDASKGDEAVLYQLAGETVPAAGSDGGVLLIQHASDALTVKGLTMVSGGTATISGALSPLAQTETFDAIYDFPSFMSAAAAGDFPDGGVNDAYNAFSYILSEPITGQGAYWSVAENTAISVHDKVPAQDLSLTYGLIEPTWPRYILTMAAELVRFHLPLPDGGMGTAQTSLYNRSTSVLPQTAGTSIAAVLTPVRDLSVNGASVAQPLSDVGVNPVVSWMAPATGQADWYRITVSELVTEDGFIRMNQTADLSTADRSVRLPPGILQPGKVYVFKVTAYMNAAADPRHTPYPLTFPTAEADAITNLVRP